MVEINNIEEEKPLRKVTGTYRFVHPCGQIFDVPEKAFIVEFVETYSVVKNFEESKFSACNDLMSIYGLDSSYGRENSNGKLCCNCYFNENGHITEYAKNDLVPKVRKALEDTLSKYNLLTPESLSDVHIKYPEKQSEKEQEGEEEKKI